MPGACDYDLAASARAARDDMTATIVVTEKLKKAVYASLTELSDPEKIAQRAKRTKSPGRPTHQRQIRPAAASLTRGQVNAVRAAFKAGVTPSRIVRQFGLSQSDVRKALSYDEPNQDRYAKVVSHGRYVAFQMAEVVIPRQMFQEILRLIAELRTQPPPAPAIAFSKQVPQGIILIDGEKLAKLNDSILSGFVLRERQKNQAY
jgi:hypothetical protein